MKALALAAIAFYQRVISPRKGFSCAYRVHTGGVGCSAYGRRVIARCGLLRGLALLRRRLALCAQCHQQLAAARRPHAHRAQAGFCDLPCDGCDFGSASLDGCDIAGAAIDVLGNCGPCDLIGCGNWSRKSGDKYVVVKPNSNLKRRPPPRHPPAV